MNDWQLLEDYARTGSETAFAQLVERYLGLVHSAARRQLNDDGLAADVSQAVFLLLARKAGSFGRGVVLSGWLFRTTRFVAARAQRTESRRQRREQEAHAMQELNADTPHWNRIAPELDDAIARLPESDRNALLLRFAEGRNHREIGSALGLTEAAARQRVGRALDKLRGVLAGRGVVLTVALLTGMLTERLVAAPPAGLAVAITRDVVSGAGNAGLATSLAGQVAAAWRWTRIQWALATLGVIAVVAALLFSPNNTPLEKTSATSDLASSTTASARLSPSRRVVAGETLRLTVVAADTGELLSGARVLLNFVVNSQWLVPEALITDAEGVCVIPLPPGDLGRVDAGAHVPGYENRFFTWRSDWQQPRPEAYTMRLGRADVVGGHVVDEQRRPVAGVAVWLSYAISDTSWREPEQDRERLGFMRRFEIGTTDTQGRWSCATIPPTIGRFGFEFEHPDYVKHTGLVVSRDDKSPGGLELKDTLRTGKALTQLRRGLVAFGRVVDSAGDPVAMARIASAWHEDGVSTDADGQFRLQGLPSGDLLFVATAPGFAPKQFQAVGGGEALRIQMEPGGQLRVRILNPEAEPIAGATLLLDEGFGAGALGWHDVTDADGWLVWTSAPRNETRTFTAHAPGYQMSREISLRTDGSEQTVTLRPELIVVGNVVDASTGEPLTRFKAVPGEGTDSPNFDRSELFYGTNGVYRLKFREGGAMVIRIEAEGFTTEVGRPNPGVKGEPRCDFKMQREDPASGVRGIVKNPDGSPAAGAEVVLCTLEQGAILRRGSFRQEDFTIITNTDTAGGFRFPPVRAPHTVTAVSAAGFGKTSTEPGSTVELRLQPFGTIEGVVRRNGQPLAAQTLQLLDPSYNYISGAVTLDTPSFQAVSDGEGRFRLGTVPAGDLRLYLYPGIGKPLTDETQVTVQAGRTVSVIVGEPDPAGRTIVGRLKASESGIVSDWRSHVLSKSLSRMVRVGTPPPELSEEASKMWLVRWHQSAEGMAKDRERASYNLVFTSADTFEVRGVPVGEYQLSVMAQAEGQGVNEVRQRLRAKWFGYALQTILVPEATAVEQATPLDVGEVDVKIQRLDGK